MFQLDVIRIVGNLYRAVYNYIFSIIITFYFVCKQKLLFRITENQL